VVDVRRYGTRRWVAPSRNRSGQLPVLYSCQTGCGRPATLEGSPRGWGGVSSDLSDYDLTIVGAGPAGLRRLCNAASRVCRGGHRVSGARSQAGTTSMIEKLPRISRKGSAEVSWLRGRGQGQKIRPPKSCLARRLADITKAGPGFLACFLTGTTGAVTGHAPGKRGRGVVSRFRASMGGHSWAWGSTTARARVRR